MRLIGQCPACGKDDQCVRVEPPRGGIVGVSCRSCGQRWPSVPDAVAEAIRNGRRLLPLSIERDPHRVIVSDPPKAAIPCDDLVGLAFNRALRVVFGLGKCHAIEGGIEGVYEGEPIELRNGVDVWISLEDEHRFADASGDLGASERCQEILGQHELLLRMLLGEEELRIGLGWSRGAILKLHDRDSCPEEKVKLLLWCTIQQCCGGQIVEQVFRQLGWVVSRAALAFYAPGMSEEEIAERFWLRESVVQNSS